MRVIRALHELGVEAVAVYSTADEDALHVRLADRAVRIGPARRLRELPQHRGPHRRGRDDRLRGRPSRLRLRLRERRLRPRVRGQRPRLHRPARRRDGADGGQGAREGRDARRGRPARAGNRGCGRAGRSTRSRRRARLPGSAEGGRRRRGEGDAGRGGAGRPPGRIRTRLGRGAGRLRRRVALRREGDHAGPPRRDPGALRRARPRPHVRRARVLGAASPPEADRGVAVAGARRRTARGDGGRGGARLPAHRLSERGHVRVPRRSGRLVRLHRAERAAPGRASGHGGDRRRSTSCGSRCGSQRATRSPTAVGQARAAVTRSSSGSTRRTRHAGSPRRPAASNGSGRRSAPASASTRSSRTGP